MNKVILVGLCFCLFSISLFSQTKHKVQAKETIYGISKQYGVTEEAIIKANPDLKDRILQIDEIIIIPKKTGNGSTSVKSNKETIKTEDNQYYYIEIQSGQTFSEIAVKNKMSEAQLLSINPGIKDKDLIKAGDIIRVPKPKITPTGKYLVQKGDTLYGIAKKYGMSITDLYALNRNLQSESIKEGTYINIIGAAKTQEVKTEPTNDTKPVIAKSETKPAAKPISKPAFVKTENGNFVHIVKKDENVFSILKIYNLSLDELMDANPNLQSGLSEGMKIIIPADESLKPVLTGKYNIVKDDTIEIALFLPLNVGSAKKDINSTNAADFFAGAYLACDSLIKQGRKIRLKSMDSGSSTEFNNILATYDFSKTDVIIGPFYKSDLIAVATKIGTNEIPIVAPVSTHGDLLGYSNVIMATSNYQYLADRIKTELDQKYNDEKIYILSTPNESVMAEYLKKAILKEHPNAQVQILFNADEIVVEKNLLTEEEVPTIAILASENEKTGTEFVSRLKKLSVNKVKTFSMFYVNAFDDANNAEVLNNTYLVYTTERKVNIDGKNEKKALKKFKDKYCKNPSRYEVIGFDVVYDVVSRMDDQGNIIEMGQTTTQLATKFEYKQSDSGAYYNVGYRVLKLYPVQ